MIIVTVLDEVCVRKRFSSSMRSSCDSCLHTKLEATFVLPVPLLTSLSGYLQMGRLTVANAGVAMPIDIQFRKKVCIGLSTATRTPNL